MKRIYKYMIPIDDYIEIEMPVGAKIIHVESQKNIGCIWALIDTHLYVEKEIRRFRLFGTGQDMIDIDFEKQKHIGTFMLFNGDLVYHLYEG